MTLILPYRHSQGIVKRQPGKESVTFDSLLTSARPTLDPRLRCCSWSSAGDSSRARQTWVIPSCKWQRMNANLCFPFNLFWSVFTEWHPFSGHIFPSRDSQQMMCLRGQSVFNLHSYPVKEHIAKRGGKYLCTCTYMYTCCILSFW